MPAGRQELPNNKKMFGHWNLVLGYCLIIGAWNLVIIK
jgi:hypothetical protein